MFVTPVHALARAATRFWGASADQLVTQLAVDDATIRAGMYLFAFERWEELASRVRTRLVGVAVGLEDGAEVDLPSHRLLEIVRSANAVPKAAPVPVPDAASEGLDLAVHRLRRQAISELQATNAALVDQQLASLDLYYRALIAQLDGVLASTTNERIIRMKTSERARREAEHGRRRAELDGRRDADIVSERIAVGVLEVSRAS